MRKKIALVFALAMLVTLMIVPTVFAESPRKIPVVVTRIGTSYNLGDYWTTSGDTYHVRETSVGFDTYSVTGIGVYLTGSASDTGVGNVNLKNGVGHINYDSQLIFQDGTFKGTISVSGTFTVVPEIPPPIFGPPAGTIIADNTTQKGVWHGTGQYLGWTLVLEFQTTNGGISLPLVGYLSVPPNFTPMTTPPPSSTELLTSQIRDAAMNFIELNHPETAKFMSDLSWIGGSANPEFFVGSVNYKYFSDGWTVTVSYPVIPNPTYSVRADYSAFSKGINYEIAWSGTWQSNVVNEISYLFTQQKPNAK